MPGSCAPRPELGAANLRVRALPISQIKPNPRNARTHSAKQIRQIADSIVAFGFTNPVLVSEDGELIAGHGRYEAAKLLGLETGASHRGRRTFAGETARPCDRRQQDRGERRMGSRAPRDRNTGIGRVC